MSGVSLSLLVLKTHQVDSLQQFYGTIGIELAEEQHGKGSVHYAGRIGGVVIEIYPLQEGDEADATTRLGFVVEDLGNVLESLWRRQLSPLAKPWQTEWGLRAVVRDPDGRSVELYNLQESD